MPSLETRFWSKADKSGPNGCWIWRASRVTGGYGCFRSTFGTKRAHRIAWVITSGPIPDGLFVCHRCDVRDCVNPAHLFLGTAADNSADMVSKGRHRSGAHSGTMQRGETHPTAKLTAAQVREIRKLHPSHSYRAIGRRFGVGRTAIHRIISGARWSSVA